MAKFSVIVMKPGIKTAGGLIYPKEVVKKAVKDFKNSKEDLKFKILNVSKEVFNIDFLEEAAFSDNISSSKMEYTDDGIKISFNLNKKTEEYKNLDDVIKQNATYKQAMFLADQQLKQLRRKAVIVINDDRYKL